MAGDGARLLRAASLILYDVPRGRQGEPGDILDNQLKPHGRPQRRRDNCSQDDARRVARDPVNGKVDTFFQCGLTNVSCSPGRGSLSVRT